MRDIVFQAEEVAQAQGALRRRCSQDARGLQMAGGGDTSGAPQDHRRISDMPVAAARGRQSVWSCRATRGGHRQGFENAIFTFPAAYSYRGQCGGRRSPVPGQAIL